MKLAQVDFDAFEDLLTPKFPGGNTLGDVISAVIPYVFQIAGFILLFYLVYGGYQYLTSMGDPKGIENARKNLTWAIVGFIVIFVAYWIVGIVGTILGLPAITDIF